MPLTPSLVPRHSFTPESAGKKSFTGELRFAVCEGEKACVPKTEKISFTVDVK